MTALDAHGIPTIPLFPAAPAPAPWWPGSSSAPALAQALLGPGTRRHRHSAGVARAAAAAAAAVPPTDTGLLVAAAWLHDIGYSEQIAATGFHPLDGARHLRSLGAPLRLCSLVANHTSAAVEAAARGLLSALTGEFPAERSATADALTWADLTTSPDGDPVTAEQRLAEVLTRYPPGHVVHTCITAAAPDLLAVAARVEARLADTPGTTTAALPGPPAAAGPAR